MPYNAAATAKSKNDVTVALTTLENYLSDKTYLVGHKVSRWDVRGLGSVVPLFRGRGSSWD